MTNADSGYRLTGAAIEGEETVAVVDRVDPEVRPTFDFPRPTFDFPRPTFDFPRPTFDFPYIARRAGNGVDE